MEDFRQSLLASGISAQTFNFYLQAIKQFCKWMTVNRRANRSPVEFLHGLNVSMLGRSQSRPPTANADALTFCRCGKQGIRVDSPGQPTPSGDVENAVLKANGGIRTHNPWFTKPELCH